MYDNNNNMLIVPSPSRRSRTVADKHPFTTVDNLNACTVRLSAGLTRGAPVESATAGGLSLPTSRSGHCPLL